MNRALTLVLLLVAALGLALRAPRLDQRPLHNDEAVNAVKFGALWERGEYKYDPNEYHGPALEYATYALARLTGAPALVAFSDARLRVLTVCFGVGLVLLLPLVVDGLGRRGMLWAGFFTAVSPAMVFYSGYYIHEMLLVFFTFLALGAGWRYWRTRRVGWALLAGAGLGLMQATKETFVLTLFAAVVALVLNQVWNRYLDASGVPIKAPRLNYWHLVAAGGVWAAVAVVLFSSFFSNPAGILDAVRTYLPWLHRAGGESPHLHPWSFYLQRLLWFHTAKGPVWTEALVLVLGLVGAGAGFFRKRLGRASASFVRFLAFYTLVLTGIYCGLAYKTPWCLLSFWHGMLLLAGVGTAVLLRTVRSGRTFAPSPGRGLQAASLWKGEEVVAMQTLGTERALKRPEGRAPLWRWRQGASVRGRALRGVVAVLVVAGGAHLAWQAWEAKTDYATDPRNPYLYTQTLPGVFSLVQKIEALAAASPRGDDTVIKVMSPESYWPLPWYLRRFKHVGWWESVPDEPYAPIMIASARLHAGLDEKKTHLMVHIYELRPGVFLELYVELDLWKAYLAKRSKPVE